MIKNRHKLMNDKDLSYYTSSYSDSQMWVGNEDLAGKRVIVFCEQGKGDVIQFLRYIPLLKGFGCEVIVHCSSDLHCLLPFSGVDTWLVKTESNLPEHDYHVLLLDLPFLLLKERPSIHWWWEGIHLESYMSKIIDNIPIAPYINFLETTDLEMEGLKIGIAWEGNPIYPLNEDRCCPLKYFNSLPDTLFSLQKEVFRHELWEGWDKNLFGVKINDYLDTARLINSLDLVVTVDTSVMHLAGALGKRTFGLLGKNHDARWGSSKKTAWYPSIEFYRNRGDWSKVFTALKKDI